MANVNLIPSNDISITQSEDNIYLRVSKDNAVSTSSTKCVENQAITNYVNEKVLQTYSTSETRIGTWIDGKPLYRKTIVFPDGTGQTTVKTYNLIDYGISNVDEIFIVHPSFYTLGGRRYPFQYNDGSAFECNITTTQLNITLGYSAISTSKFVITAEYTKTTD